jgi:glycosyltransferase involved in cell wall biosynthesis
MTGSARVLITVSGTIDVARAEQAARGERPRIDYVELARAMDAELLDVDRSIGHGRIRGRLARLLGPTICLAVGTFRAGRRGDAILTDGEHVGLPLAGMLGLLPRRRRAKHVMIVHRMTPTTKSLLCRVVGRRGVDRYIVYAQAQYEHLRRLSVPAERITLMPFMVDTAFFDPTDVAPTNGQPTICSVGLEMRDYATLVGAVRDLDARVVIAADSPWSRRSSTITDDVPLPPNVESARFDLHALRQLYGSSAMVVVPLVPTDFQAGITTILEGMSMAVPVIATRTVGQTETIVDGVTGYYVAPGDVAGLREAITRVLADPAEAATVGRRARAWAVEHADIDVYVQRIARLLQGGPPSSDAERGACVAGDPKQ